MSKFDLLKWYWQVLLTERARNISSFITADGVFQYLIYPFGMKKSSCTFVRFMNKVISGLENTKVYVDDIVVYTDTWESHVSAIRALFDRLRAHHLTVNMITSEFAKATVQCLGHIAGQGRIFPVVVKVQAINTFPVPESNEILMRLLGICGFYRKFCKNLSDIVVPFMKLLKKRVEFRWTEHGG